MLQIRAYETPDFEGVRALWEEVFPHDPPWNRAELAIPEKLKVQPELFLVAVVEGDIIGTAMAGYDGHRGWLYTDCGCPGAPTRRHRLKAARCSRREAHFAGLRQDKPADSRRE